MQKLILLLCLLSFITTYGQWTQLFPTPNRNVAVDFIDENTGFIVSLEEVLKTYDAGAFWQTVNIPGSVIYFSDIEVVDSNIVWVASEGYLDSPGNGVLSKSDKQ